MTVPDPLPLEDLMSAQYWAVERGPDGQPAKMTPIHGHVGYDAGTGGYIVRAESAPDGGDGMDDGLIAFANARLDEEETTAGQSRTWTVDHHECDDYCETGCEWAAECAVGKCLHEAVSGSDGMQIYDEGGHDAGDAAHIALHDPARVLREVAAKRRRLERYLEQSDYDLPEGICDGRDPDERKRDEALKYALETEVCEDAAVWSDHPDYKQRWKP